MSSRTRRTVLRARRSGGHGLVPDPGGASAARADDERRSERYPVRLRRLAPHPAVAKSVAAPTVSASTHPRAQHRREDEDLCILRPDPPTRSSSRAAAGTALSTAAKMRTARRLRPRATPHAPASRWPPPHHRMAPAVPRRSGRVNDTNVASLPGHPRHSDHIANADDCHLQVPAQGHTTLNTLTNGFQARRQLLWDKFSTPHDRP